MSELLADSYGLSLAIVIGWSAVCFGVAAFFCKSFGASRNPIEWLPFFFLGPLILLVASFAIAMLIPIGLLLSLTGFAALPFRKTPEFTSNGLSFRQRVRGTEETLAWNEIKEWKTIENYPCDTHAILTTAGKWIELPPLNIQEVTPYLIEYDIPVVAETL
ncbi:hypothetical protein [Novipirellula rosea]